MAARSTTSDWESSYAEKKQQDCIMCKFLFHIFSVYLKPSTNHHTENMRRLALSHTRAINSRRCFSTGEGKSNVSIVYMEIRLDSIEKLYSLGIGDNICHRLMVHWQSDRLEQLTLHPFSTRGICWHVKESEKRGFRRTPYSYTVVHALAVNIDMVCELSAALLCLCKKYKSCAKNLRIYFLCASFLDSSSSLYREIQKLLLRFATSDFFCVVRRGTECLVIFRVLVDDETHVWVKTCWRQSQEVF